MRFIKWIAKAIGYLFVFSFCIVFFGLFQAGLFHTGDYVFFLVIAFFLGYAFILQKKAKQPSTQESVTVRIITNENDAGTDETSDKETVGASGMSSGKRYKITYVDSNRQKTERVIKPFRMDKYYVDAYCELRREERTFSFDRIQQIIDVSTGEIITFPHAKSGDSIYQGKRGGYYAIDAKGKKKYLTKIGT